MESWLTLSELVPVHCLNVIRILDRISIFHVRS